MLDEDFLMEIIDMTKIKGAWGSMEDEYVHSKLSVNYILTIL